MRSTAFLPILSLNFPQKGVKIINMAAEMETRVLISISVN